MNDTLELMNALASSSDQALSLSDGLLLLKRVIRPVYQRVRTLEAWARHHLGVVQPESKLKEEAQRFWNSDDKRIRQFSHWKGAGIFADASRWQEMGAQHLELYLQFKRMMGVQSPPERVVEWGCGGGANAVHFAPIAVEFVGVDISQENLAECERQLAQRGVNNFIPHLIDTARPEDVSKRMPGPCDLFLCTYVFEVLPSPEYGLQVLAIAFELLANDGMAIIQVKYAKDGWSTQPKRFGYRHNFTTMTTYRIDAFWTAAERIGFTPKAVTLVPCQPLNGNGDYAYFLLHKPAKPV
jgi:SAM-dependent methyltransferase